MFEIVFGRSIAEEDIEIVGEHEFYPAVLISGTGLLHYLHMRIILLKRIPVNPVWIQGLFAHFVNRLIYHVSVLFKIGRIFLDLWIDLTVKDRAGNIPGRAEYDVFHVCMEDGCRTECHSHQDP